MVSPEWDGWFTRSRQEGARSHGQVRQEQQRFVAKLDYWQVRDVEIREVAPQHDADLAQEEQVINVAKR